MYKLIVIIFVALVSLNATSLKLENGLIKAHTEVFGDSTIDPETKVIYADLKMDDSIESIIGEFEISPLNLISDNKDRDEHMYKVLNIDVSPTINFNLKSILKKDDKYELKGVLILNNVKKQIVSLASINEENGTLQFQGDFSIKLTDFNLEPPTMLFLTVRDQIDINYNFNFKKGE